MDMLHLKKETVFDTGVLLDDDRDVEALWLPYLIILGTAYVGVQVFLLVPAFERLQQGSFPKNTGCWTLNSKGSTRIMCTFLVSSKV